MFLIRISNKTVYVFNLNLLVEVFYLILNAKQFSIIIAAQRIYMLDKNHLHIHTQTKPSTRPQQTYKYLNQIKRLFLTLNLSHILRAVRNIPWHTFLVYMEALSSHRTKDTIE